MIAHDLYAETNPAWGAYVLSSFLRGFEEVESGGADMPLAYLGLPICLSGDLASTFEGANKRTGLREWVERSPQIQLELGERLNASMPMVTDSIRLACFTGAVVLDRAGRLKTGSLRLKDDLSKGLSVDLSGPVKRADRLGFWVAASGSTKTAFDILGMSL